ncbi:hypothetical protein FSP39_004412 [Pinctada imbricata]|uniref:Alanine--glyoxylate aminotransferase n=1 Tax=Pinctada imbricata TaxID=66713 RepID=A0AA88YFJ8_PINIB|nr:hypothetical protein FSP39_004412 [Pinctada imbricata]
MTSVTSPPECLLKPMVFPQKLMMGPGPSNCPPRVLNACAMPILGHLHPEFTKIMDEVKAGIKYMFQTQNEWTVCVSGTGHAAMEAACCNLLESGENTLVCCNGLWGERFSDMAERNGAVVQKIHKPMGEVFTLGDIEEVCVLSPDLYKNNKHNMPPKHWYIFKPVAHIYNCLLLVDSVAACGGVPMFMDKWEIDALYTGSQKVLSAPPGVSPISFSSRAKSKIQSRKTKVRSWYFDMNELSNYWGCDDGPRRYHHTGPINTVYALREGLARLADESSRLPCVSGVKVPDGVNWKDVSNYAMENYKVEIAGGLGAQAGKIWRIGVMGSNATPDNVKMVLRALGEAIKNVQRQK